MIEIIPNWHPIFVHFTIGLLGTAVLFFLFSIVLPVSDGLKTNWQVVARWCLWTGMAVTLLTILAGYSAYNSVAHDTPSHIAMTEHGYWAFTTGGVFILLTLWSIWLRLQKQSPDILFLVFALICGGLLVSTAWHGGELVYRHGLGVMSLPQTDSEHSTSNDRSNTTALSETRISETKQQKPGKEIEAHDSSHLHTH